MQIRILVAALLLLTSCGSPPMNKGPATPTEARQTKPSGPQTATDFALALLDALLEEDAKSFETNLCVTKQQAEEWVTSLGSHPHPSKRDDLRRMLDGIEQTHRKHMAEFFKASAILRKEHGLTKSAPPRVKAIIVEPWVLPDGRVVGGDIHISLSWKTKGGSYRDVQVRTDKVFATKDGWRLNDNVWVKQAGED
jgi:hypothetical protein